MRWENTWHEIRDHSFIQNHSRSSDSQLLLFSSLIFYRVQIREHLTQDQRPFLHPESLQIFRFTASPLQFTHSSSTGFRSENTWHEIRDHSFIQNHSRSSDSQLLLFSSPHSSSTGFRSENTGHEIRDHSFIQNHSRSSDSQLLLFSSLIFYRVQVREHLTRDQRPFLHPESLQIFRYTASPLQFTSLIFYRVQVREHLTRDQRPFLHPESLQIFRFTASSLQFTSLIFYRVQVREHLTRDQRPFLHPESLQIFRYTASPLQFTSLIFYRVQVREHLTRDQRPFLHPESLQIFRFTASPLQFTSLIFYRVQVREHLTRDQRPFLHPESLQIFRFTASPLQFTHLLQGSGQRTPDTRSETIPSSRITPDLQIHSFFSSVHSPSTGFRSENTWHKIRDHSFIQNHSRSSDSQLLLFSSPHSSSTGFRSENTWHEIRDHFFIQNHSRSSDSQLLLFSSPHSSSTGFRSENTWHEIRDHSFIQNHSRSSDSQLLLFSSPHSSSTGFRSENTWHEIRDHSFIQNHSRSSDSQLLLFSSLTHLLQGSGQRTPDPRSETIPSSRITPDLQIHSFSSSVHSLIFYRVQVREHLTRDQRPFLHPESLQIFRFTASSLQFTHSSSTGFRSENTWHEIRDHSFIQNHSRSSDSQLLLFTSLIFYRVQIREHLTRDQRPFLHPESLQIFRFTASPLQFTSLIFYRVQIREHLTRDQRPFLHPESLQIFRFTASPLQFTHSSSTGFRSENTWHEIRDHSFIQNHSRSSDSQLLLFSSLTHLLQGSDQRTPDTRSETIPSSRITPDLQIHSFFSSVHLTHLLQGSGQRTPDTRSETIPSSRITPDLQIHSFFSSVHLTRLLQGSGQRTPDTRSETIPSSRITPDLQIHSFSSSVHSLIFYRVQVRGLEWPAEAWFCAQWHIFVLFLRFVFGLLYGWKIQTWPIIRFLTESITYWFFYLLVFDIIHDATCLNKMSRTSSRNIGPQH